MGLVVFVSSKAIWVGGSSLVASEGLLGASDRSR